jgi:hypothetical protein
MDLGLELKSRKAPVETIIVDHVEKIPTANRLPIQMCFPRICRRTTDTRN